MSSVLDEMARRYPQLYLEPAQGMSESETYKDVVLRGKRPAAARLHGFSGSVQDSLNTQSTPAGEVEILYLPERGDFERFIRIMMYRCEPAIIPENMGAAIISGIINWQKIERHQMQYLLTGSGDLEKELSRFTADKSNYLDTVIVVSRGEYSNLAYKATPYGEAEWLALSLKIRTFHECAHFVCQRLFPELKNVLWDEILADCFGLLNATGNYNPDLAKTFFGVSPDGYMEGGRLKNYIPGKTDLNATARSASVLIDRVAELITDDIRKGKDPYEILNRLEKRSREFCETLTDSQIRSMKRKENLL